MGHSSPSAIEPEDKEAFRLVHSGKSSGENTIFSSQKVFRVVLEYAHCSQQFKVAKRYMQHMSEVYAITIAICHCSSSLVMLQLSSCHHFLLSVYVLTSKKKYVCVRP